MKRSEHKSKKSIYEGVFPIVNNGKQYVYKASKKHKGKHKQSNHETEREAAIAYDKFCIEFGLPPVNILKAKI